MKKTFTVAVILVASFRTSMALGFLEPDVEASPKIESPSPDALTRLFSRKNVSFKLPKSWLVADFSQKNWKDNLKRKGGTEEMLVGAEFMDSGRLGMRPKVLAYIPSASTKDFASNMNLAEVPIPNGFTDAQIMDANLDQVSSVSLGDFKSEEVLLGKVKGQRIVFESTVNKVQATFISVIAIKNKQQIVFTFTTSTQFFEKLEPQFNQVIKSIKIFD